ncbi:YcxB family protein [Actinotalea solisilvae]|uniref:YcxB family protein n=1 Tax=Actinotalea solisilvae TaxID=2072922 RepID=UPI003557CAA3
MTADDRATVELAWTPEQADYVDAYRARDRADRRLRAFTLLGGAVVVACVAAALSGTPDLLPLAAGVGVGVLAAPLATRHAVRRLWRAGLAGRGPTRARVEPGVGITSVSRGATTQTEWTHLTRLLETRRSFVLTVGGQRVGYVTVLPKRGLQDPADVDRLRALLAHETRAARDGAARAGALAALGATDAPWDAPAAPGPASPSDAVTLRWLPAVEDYVEAFEARSRARRTRRLAVLLGALALVALGAVLTREPVTVVLLLLVAAMAVLERPMLRRAVRRSWGKEPALREERIARLAPDDGLVVDAGASSGRYGWDRVARVVETERSFVLLSDRAWSGTFWLLAKRGAASPGDVDRVRALLARHVGSAPPRVGQVGLEPTTDGL